MKEIGRIVPSAKVNGAKKEDTNVKKRSRHVSEANEDRRTEVDSPHLTRLSGTGEEAFIYNFFIFSIQLVIQLIFKKRSTYITSRRTNIIAIIQKIKDNSN